MDEPCSALDPVSTTRIEELIAQLRADHAVVIVTHNLAQARRVADRVAFMYLGDLVEVGDTNQVFEAPANERTRDYVGGAFG
jgi:phosphate transport system ATP-binding protein